MLGVLGVSEVLTYLAYITTAFFTCRAANHNNNKERLYTYTVYSNN